MKKLITYEWDGSEGVYQPSRLEVTLQNPHKAQARDEVSIVSNGEPLDINDYSIISEPKRYHGLYPISNDRTSFFDMEELELTDLLLESIPENYHGKKVDAVLVTDPRMEIRFEVEKVSFSCILTYLSKR